ncbi:hypothetical protein AMS68_003917 [Peltaster fructicola]|uniref:Uncharacterized protein n=1 Tax=Peltaster fructicola TaxID=286661 RepID=A0A6H0XVC7_9PEZI|nr:hypothetical protein AMS68_003917 [Peltaster fructicola]
MNLTEKAAKVNKRPLHRPAIPSAYTSSAEAKVVYVSAKTPFMSAVKRVDKLLQLAEKRDVQSAAATVRNENPHKRRKVDADRDEIATIAQHLNDREDKEKVVVKGTGKAIARALEIGLWFQQRQQYAVTLKTGTVQSIDDIEVDETPPPPSEVTTQLEDMADNDPTTDAVSSTSKNDTTMSTAAQKLKSFLYEDSGQRDETRVRSVSVIEVYISLR